MNAHAYATWTYEHVRDRIVEAADTLIMNPAAPGPYLIGSSLFNEYKDGYVAGEATRVRILPSPGALARMEETWTWINSILEQDDRKLVYEYGFIMTRKGYTIAGWCEHNGWIRRTFERAVNRACQQIANDLNRKHRVRLTMAFDVVSQITAKDTPSDVASDNRAPVMRQPYYRAEGATPAHIPGSEPETAHHIEKVNQQRREEAERQRKRELRKAEEAARRAQEVADREAKARRRKAA